MRYLTARQLLRQAINTVRHNSSILSSALCLLGIYCHHTHRSMCGSLVQAPKHSDFSEQLFPQMQVQTARPQVQTVRWCRWALVTFLVGEVIILLGFWGASATRYLSCSSSADCWWHEYSVLKSTRAKPLWVTSSWMSLHSVHTGGALAGECLQR